MLTVPPQAFHGPVDLPAQSNLKIDLAAPSITSSRLASLSGNCSTAANASW